MIFKTLLVYIGLTILLQQTCFATTNLIDPLRLPDLPADNDDSSLASIPNPDEVDPCEACRLVVKSFERGMEETSRGKHEGGDTSWEEKNLKSYADSEIRLVEIQEKLCEDVKSKGKTQCFSLAEDTESDVEDWWHHQRTKNVRLFDYLCISKLKKCCSSGNFGPNCQPCPSECNRHGQCDGDGTRSGTGKCLCEPGYEGEFCDSCSDDHFKTTTSDHFNCLECDPACKTCFGPGRLNCTECKSGYHRHELNGCIDINECDISLINEAGENPKRPCEGNTYCVNTDGSYKCRDCHESCDGCVAYGPDLCLSCSLGYSLDSENFCRTEEDILRQEKWEKIDQNKQGPLGRYFFYAGILIISIIMFGLRSNLYIMYPFILGFIVFLILKEFNLLDEMQEYTSISSE